MTYIKAPSKQYKQYIVKQYKQQQRIYFTIINKLYFVVVLGIFINNYLSNPLKHE